MRQGASAAQLSAEKIRSLCGENDATACTRFAVTPFPLFLSDILTVWPVVSLLLNRNIKYHGTWWLL